MKNILVTGATGQLGSAVIENLLESTDAGNIHALVRNPEKAAAIEEKGVTVLIGDYNDYGSLVTSFKGIEVLYMISNNDIPNRITQQDNVVRAAADAGVAHIVYTSFQRENETESSPISTVVKGHRFTEQQLSDWGITYTILRHGMYMDLIPNFLGKDILDKQIIYLPAGDGKAAFVSRKDLAAAGAAILLDETGNFDNKTILLSGAEALSWNDIAAILSDITQKQIKYMSPSEEEYKAALTKAGVPPMYIALFSNFIKAIKEGEFTETTDRVEQITGNKPVSVSEYLSAIFNK